MGVNNDNPCPICGNIYSDYAGDSIFICRGCENIFNNAIQKWEMTKPVIIESFSGRTYTQSEKSIDAGKPNYTGEITNVDFVNDIIKKYQAEITNIKEWNIKIVAKKQEGIESLKDQLNWI